MSPPQRVPAGPSPSLLPFQLGKHSLLSTVSLCQAGRCRGTRGAPYPPPSAHVREARGEVGAGAACAWRWSKVCVSLCRMRQRAARNWSTGGWLPALCLVWLWTLLASASLRPPAPTGLGEVVGPGESFPRILESWTPPHPFDSRQISSEAESSPQIPGVLAPPLLFTQETLPPLLPWPRKRRQSGGSPSPSGQKVFCRERGPGWGLQSRLLA